MMVKHEVYKWCELCKNPHRGDDYCFACARLTLHDMGKISEPNVFMRHRKVLPKNMFASDESNNPHPKG